MSGINKLDCDFSYWNNCPPQKPRDIAFNPISPYEVSILYASVHVCFAL